MRVDDSSAISRSVREISSSSERSVMVSIGIAASARGAGERGSFTNLLLETANEPLRDRWFVAGAAERLVPLRLGQTSDEMAGPPHVVRGDSMAHEIAMNRVVVEFDVAASDSVDERMTFKHGRII